MVCGLGVISALGPAGARFVDWVFAAFAVAAGLALAAAALRRELRIRRRLAGVNPLTPAEAAWQRPTRARATIGDRP